MRVVVDGDRYEGGAVDLRDRDVDADALLAAIRGNGADSDDGTDRNDTVSRDVESIESGTGSVQVACLPPTPSHDALGHIDNCRTSLRSLLAAAARSRGQRAPQRPAYETVKERLGELQIPDVDVADARRRVAAVGDDEARLREQMATLRGRLQVHRETGTDASEVATALTDAATRLSEVETERVAAEQTLNRQERRAQAARTTRERRLELQDRAANLEREMRTSLAAAVYPAFTAALDSFRDSAIPGDASRDAVALDGAASGDDPSEYGGDLLTAQLGAVRIADLDAPVVVSAPVFDDAMSATTQLNSSVILR